MIKIKLENNERIDDLEINNLKIIQNSDFFCFGIDSVLLSDFAKDIKKDSIIVDLGSGTGIISILLNAKCKLKKIYEIEIQEKVAKMAKKSIILNKLEEKIEIINDDINNLKKYFKANSIDAIVSNPPYKKINTGKLCENKEQMISRFEVKSNLEEFFKISSYLLKNKGEFYMVNRPERLVDIMEYSRKYNLEPKLIRFVYPKVNKVPNLVLIKFIKNSNKFIKFEKPLIIYNEDNSYTNEILKIYGKIN